LWRLSPGFSWIQEKPEETEKDSTRRPQLASFRSNLEKPSGEGIPSLMEMESGKLVGAVLPMSEQAQIQMRDSIEVIEYLLNQERVIWS
jgi:hypothetical protein